MLKFEVANRFREIHTLASDLARVSGSWDGLKFESRLHTVEELAAAIQDKIQWLKENKQ